MNDRYYLVLNSGEVHGPVSAEQAVALVAAGQARATSFARVEDSAIWKPLGSLVEIPAAVAASAAPQPPPIPHMKAPSKSRGAWVAIVTLVIWVPVFFLLIQCSMFVGESIYDQPKPTATAAAVQTYAPTGLVSASGRMFPGTMLYQRSGDFVGTIIDPGPKIVTIRMASGSVEQKTRQTVRDYYYVKE